jgi:galactose mutarotase-like enzyme
LTLSGTRIACSFQPGVQRSIVIENEFLRTAFRVDRGCDLTEFLYKPRDIDFLWHRPGPIRRSDSGDNSRTDIRFLDQYQGGWQELFPQAGAAAEYRGATLPFHGEAWALPWEFEIRSDDPAEGRVSFWTRTTLLPLCLRRDVSLTAGAAILRFDETVTNESGEAIEFMWGHHPAFGAPLLDEDSIVEAPAKLIQVGGSLQPWPIDSSGIDHSRLVPENSDHEVMKYLHELRAGWVALTHPRQKVGIGLIFDPEIFPYVWLWQEFGYTQGYPWFGSAYVLGMEPQSSLPRARESGGRLLRLAAGASLNTQLLAVAYEAVGVRDISREGRITPR